MLDNPELIFTDLELMLRKLKKSSYEANMKKFRESHGDFIDKMIRSVCDSDDRDVASEAVANDFAEGIFDAFSRNGKIGGRKLADMNFFMIYYIFPAILLTGEDCADDLCKAVKMAWNEKFNTNIGYTDYDTLYSSFRNKIFGIF